MISKKRRQLKIIGFFILPAYLLYCEILFKLFTVRTCPPLAWVATIMFSVGIGLVISMLTGISKKTKPNRIVRGVLMCVIAILFLTNIFIYKQFKIFYEPATVFAGARGVATGFMDHVWKLIFSVSGIAAIILYIVPIVVYFIFGYKIDSGKRTSFYNLLQLAVVLAIVSAASLVVVRTNEVLNGVYSTRYNFQSAVADFGLATGVRLDATRSALRKMGINSTTTAKNEEWTISPEEYKENITREGAIVDKELEEAAASIVYGKSVMNIDFAELARETNNNTIAEIDEYVAGLTPSSQNEYTGIFKGKNLILITAEAFSHHIIDPELTPTLYRLSTKGINFTDYTQQASAGTIGGEYQSIFGLFPTAAGDSFMRMRNNLNWFTMASQLTRQGYYGRPFHNGEYDYYDRYITHNSIGYSDEYLARGNGMEEMISDLFWPGSDEEMFEETLKTYIDKQPFNVYYMTVSGHSMYTREGHGIVRKNWDYVENLDMSERLKGYYAANLDLEFALAKVIDALERAGIANDTVIVMTADHFPYGLDDEGGFGNLPYLEELYGYAPMNYLERDENGLIIWCGEMEKWETITVDTPVSSLDILPTLSNLFGLEWDSRLLPGRDVFSDSEPLVFDFAYDWKTDKGTYIAAQAEFTPVEGEVIPPGYVERINRIVDEKMDYCWNVMEYDYYRHVIEDSGYLEQ